MYITRFPYIYIFPLIKFRSSCHKLEIELGRRIGIIREKRFCKSCDMNVLGDEFHFVMECSSYSDIRDTFLPLKYTSVKSIVFNLCNIFYASKNIKNVLSLYGSARFHSSISLPL